MRRALDEEVQRFRKLLERFSGEKELPQNLAADAVEAVQLAEAGGRHDHLVKFKNTLLEWQVMQTKSRSKTATMVLAL